MKLIFSGELCEALLRLLVGTQVIGWFQMLRRVVRPQFCAPSLIDRVQIEFDMVGIVDALGIQANLGLLRRVISSAGLHGVGELSCLAKMCVLCGLSLFCCVVDEKCYEPALARSFPFRVACRDVVKLFSSCWPDCA